MSQPTARCCRALLLAVGLSLVLVSFAPAAFAQQDTPPAVAIGPSTPVKDAETTPANGTNAEAEHLAQQQGSADSAVLDWVLANSGPYKGDLRAGELRIAFTLTPAEGWWDKAAGNTLAWHEPPTRSAHLRIFIVDTDGRLVPGLTVRASLLDASGNEQSAPADFGWYPLLNAYGGNVTLDSDSGYTLRVTVEAAPTQRGYWPAERLAHATVAEFPPVQISRDVLAELPAATATAFANEAELLKPCNAALSPAITALWKHTASGSEHASGDYFVGYALDYSALLPGSKLRVRNMLDLSGKNSVRVVVFPRDSRTGRFIPGLKPRASLVASDGTLYGPGDLSLIWHPWFNHYEHSVKVPRKGAYKLRVHFDAPGFRRWGRQSDRFAVPLDVEFDDVSLKEEAKN